MFTTTQLIATSTVIAFISYLVAAFLLSSDSYVVKFMPPSPNDDPESSIDSRRRKLLIVEVVRLFLLAAVCYLIIILFDATDLESITFLIPPVYIPISVYVIVATVNYSYHGPKQLVKNDPRGRYNKINLREHIAPYIVRLPGAIALVVGLVGTMLVVVGNSMGLDWIEIAASRKDLGGMVITELSDLQFASFMLVDFGSRFSSVFQNYIVVAVLVFIYIVIEQKTDLRHSMQTFSMDFLKIFALLLLISTLAFSLLIFPQKYQELHSELQDNLLSMAIHPSQTNEYLDVALGVQDTLQTYDLRWLYLSIVSGYGNLALLLFIGGELSLLKLSSQDHELVVLMKLLLPEFKWLRNSGHEKRQI